MKDFNDLSIPRQKRRIVKDAIKQIQNNVVIPKRGNYLTFSRDWGDKDLQKILQNNTRVCEACAKGALFAACVLNVNDVRTSRYLNEEKLQKEKLSTWFTALELDMIEAAFEKGVVYDAAGELETEVGGSDVNTKLGDKCVKFGKKYKGAERRLLAILENILKNKVFKP